MLRRPCRRGRCVRQCVRRRLLLSLRRARGSLGVLRGDVRGLLTLEGRAARRGTAGLFIETVERLCWGASRRSFVAVRG